MRNTVSKFQKGDIYLSRFPFTSYTQSKIRPVVVLSEDKTYQDVVVMAISSVLHGWDPSSVVYVLSSDFDFENTGLKKDSCVIVNRIRGSGTLCCELYYVARMSIGGVLYPAKVFN
jgi:mRNA interferase MazF